MNEKSVADLIRKSYALAEDTELTVTSLQSMSSQVFKVDEVSECAGKTYFLKTARQCLEKQAKLAARADEIFAHDQAYSPLGLVYLSGHNAIVSRDCNMPTMSQKIAESGLLRPFVWYQNLLEMVRISGSWLSRYHKASESTGSVREPLIKYIGARSHYFEYMDRSLSTQLLDFVQQCPDHTICEIHCDFSPHNIFSNGKRLSVIDFGIPEWTEMSPYWDVATMTIALEREFRFRYRSPLKWLPGFRKRVIDEFLRAYGPREPHSAHVMNACIATRHFALFTGSCERKADSSRGKWHLDMLRAALLSNTG